MKLILVSSANMYEPLHFCFYHLLAMLSPACLLYLEKTKSIHGARLISNVLNYFK